MHSMFTSRDVINFTEINFIAFICTTRRKTQESILLEQCLRTLRHSSLPPPCTGEGRTGPVLSEGTVKYKFLKYSFFEHTKNFLPFAFHEYAPSKLCSMLLLTADNPLHPET